MLVKLSRGAFAIFLNQDDVIIISGESYSIQSMNSSFITLNLPYMGVSAENVTCYKASRFCNTGTFAVNYRPLVSGQDLVDLRINTYSVVGFPTYVDVFPGVAVPLWFVVYGPGVRHSQAGEISSFTIQARDGYGNNRLSAEEKDLLTVLVYPEEYNSSTADDFSKYTIKAKIFPQGDGRYKVEYITKASRYHTVAIVQL